MGTLISILKRFINSDLTKPINTMIDEVKAALALIKAKTDTITSNLFTATHASRIDANISSRQADVGLTTTHSSRIDASISSRADQTTANAIKAKTDLIATGLGGIKSVQRGTISLPFNTVSVSVTISSVNLTKSFLIFSNNSSIASTDKLYGYIAGTIASATSLSFSRAADNTTSSSNVCNVIDWQVVEFY